MMADHGKQDVEFWYRGKVTRRRLVGYGAGALGATMLVPAPWLAAFGQAKPLKIGTLQPLSGAAAAGGKTSLVGVQMAVDRINKAGGVNGRPIELIIADMSQSPTRDAARSRSSWPGTGSTPTRAAYFPTYASPACRYSRNTRWST
jgi:hypothetical protein